MQHSVRGWRMHGRATGLQNSSGVMRWPCAWLPNKHHSLFAVGMPY